MNIEIYEGISELIKNLSKYSCQKTTEGFVYTLAQNAYLSIERTFPTQSCENLFAMYENSGQFYFEIANSISRLQFVNSIGLAKSTPIKGWILLGQPLIMKSDSLSISDIKKEIPNVDIDKLFEWWPTYGHKIH